MILFFDTETTGKYNFKEPPQAAHQPRLVQLAAILTDDAGKELSYVNLVVKPDGFTIPAEASEIHGITTERANEVGVECSVVRDIFRSFWKASNLIVGHNIEFDLHIMDVELFRAAGGFKTWGEPRNTVCTMHNMTEVCKLPGKFGSYKWPKLQEAYKHAFGIEFDTPHDAMADIRACAKIYFGLLAQPK